jgi:SAM-dependent methyltransferase
MKEFDGRDYRLWKQKEVAVHHLVNGNGWKDNSPKFGWLDQRDPSANQISHRNLPRHLTPEMASHLPPGGPSSCVLDMGCGNGEYRETMEELGYHWTGVDFDHPDAPILADAHALPFVDSSFDLIVSLAVLEHLQYPDVAVREAFRVLKPGCMLFGSVAYLVPFHEVGGSYFNMTHQGVASLLGGAGFDVEFVMADANFLGIKALATTGMFPGMPRWAAYLLASPLVLAQRLWWGMLRMAGLDAFSKAGKGAYSKEREGMLNAGAFVFVARRPYDS